MHKVFVNLMAIFCLCFALHAEPAPSTEPPKQEKSVEPVKQEKPKPRENIIEKPHAVTIKGIEYEYTSHTGTFPLNDDKGKNTSQMFFTAYFLSKKEGTPPRPIVFCFNGGPGCATIWLHMGSFAPKKVNTIDCEATPSPGTYDVNPYSLLPDADLVFIDALSTGFSRPAENVSPEQFYGVKEDAALFAEFIRHFLSYYKKWDSKIFILGESYGTVRAVVLADALSSTYSVPVNGLILISSCLNAEILGHDANDVCMPYILPTFAATAWYHKKVSPEYLQKPLTEFLAEVEEFALKEYAYAISLGNTISPEYKKQIATTVASYTGLSPEYVYQSNNRIFIHRFYKELLRSDEKTVGRFDSRIAAFDQDPISQYPSTDPSADVIEGAYVTAYLTYLQKELGWEQNDPYYVCNPNRIKWKGLSEESHDDAKYLNITPMLEHLLVTNHNLQVHIASGFYDLATPYFAAKYVASQLNLPKSYLDRISLSYYEAGHMMYVNPKCHEQLTNILKEFINPQEHTVGNIEIEEQETPYEEAEVAKTE